MKKIVSLAMAGIMLLGACPMVYAAEVGGNWGDGTAVSYAGTGTEAYTVSIPASLTPGGAAGDVVASGTFASNRKLVVKAPESVELVNTINANDKKNPAIPRVYIN